MQLLGAAKPSNAFDVHCKLHVKYFLLVTRLCSKSKFMLINMLYEHVLFLDERRY